MRSRPSRKRATTCRAALLGLEPLEGRALLAAVSVDVGQVVRPVNPDLLGVNLAWWDSNLNTASTRQLVQAAGLTSFRFPGGSSSDEFHFNAPPSYQGQGTDASMAGFIASVNGKGMATLDYGSGSPQEAAAFLAYLNGAIGSTTVIGSGPEWSNTANAWQSVDWKTAGYWAGLRAASPLTQDDGLNFLRLGRAAPFGFHHFEVGNEVYGPWETDHHAAPHDPTTYVAFARQFATLAATIDPTISIGLDTGTPAGDYNNWIGNVLQQSVTQGLKVGFLSDHSYVQAPGAEGDANLLLNTISRPTSYDNWAYRGAAYQALLTQYLGAAGKNVDLLATEFNSVYSNPGKQTTSLVNGLFVADSLGVLLQSPYNGANVWDLRNGYDTGNNNATGLYGWRQGGDYGLLGAPGTPPSTGPNVPYPAYFAEQLAAKVVQPGGVVVKATSNDPNLTTYAVLEPNGHLALLVINKSASAALTGQFQLANFRPSGQAQVWQYGKAQDTAQSQTSDGHSALANAGVALTLNGSSFNDSFPSYSMTVLDLANGPTTYTVNSLGDAGTGTGSSGDLRYCITQADAHTGSTIQFSVGGTITLNSALPDLSADVTVTGPGEASLTVRRNPAPGTPGFGIFTVDAGVTASVSGLTLAGGNATLGGGINNLGTLTVTAVTFAGDSATYGGGINSFGTLTATGCTFSGNTAAFGAGVDSYNTGASVPSLRVINSNFLDNTSTAYGGGVFSYYGTLTLLSSYFSGNSAGYGGGGLFSLGQATVANASFTNNKADGGVGGAIANYIGQMALVGVGIVTNSAGSGGGVFNYYGTLSILDSGLYANRATATGGGLFNIGGVTIDHTTLSYNTAGGGGGGIVNPLGSVVASDTTLYGNTATGGDGGGLLNNGGAATLINVTVAANRAGAGSGGGARVESGTMTLQNTLIAGNSRGASPGTTRDDVSGALSAASSYDLIGDGTGMTGVVNGAGHNLVGSSGSPINAMLGPLASNGGPSQTAALLIGSPAIDQGNNALAVDSSGKLLTADQRNKSRVYNGTVDIGAYELQP